MIKLLKHMKKKEWIMAGICMTLVLGQVYFELTMPDYMSDLAVMVQTPGFAQSEIWGVGLRMLGCALAIIGGWFSAQVAAGFSYSIRSEFFLKISNFGKEEMDRFSVPSLVIRMTNDIRQVQMLLTKRRQDSAFDIIGNVLSIKPIIELKDKVLVRLGIARGIRKGKERLWKEYEAEAVDTEWPVYIGYTYDREKGETFRKETEERYNLPECRA